jgi:hypothetical protein
MRVKVFTRSFDLRLYRLSKGLFEQFGWPTVRLTDQSADGYFYTMLKDTDCDIAVNIDEDAFITDIQAVKDLVDRIEAEGWANIGYSDGDDATTGRNKIVTNPFFNIFNVNLIRTKFDRKLMVRSLDDYEPYCAFFYWLAKEFKTLYLPARKHPDGITTIALDESGRMVCLHTWFSRFYSMPGWLVRKIEPTQGMQKARIDAIIHEAYAIRGLEVPTFGFADKVAFFTNKLVRWTIKIPQRISRWPYKIRKKLAKKSAS